MAGLLFLFDLIIHKWGLSCYDARHTSLFADNRPVLKCAIIKEKLTARCGVAKDNFIEMSGKVLEDLPHGVFRVRIETGQNVLAYPSGKMRMHYSKILPGDMVTVEISAYDLTRGRITHHAKQKAA